MDKSPAMENSYVQLTFKCDANELVALKRAKKEPGTPTGKSVVVLKPNDVIIRDGTVFMPNTIEMAQLKKSDKGQFKTNVQISSKMTEMDIKQTLEETFPFLENKRFYCAGAADNRTRLDFHGERRIWDGRLIKKKIKGNSALYIFTDEVLCDKESVEKHDLKVAKFSELTTLKRSHDQITSPENETAERSPKKEGASEDAAKLPTIYPAVVEKHAKLLATSDSPKNVASYLRARTFEQSVAREETTTTEKSDHPSQIEGQSQLQQKPSGRFPGVSSQHNVMLSASHSGKLTSVQEDMNARDISAVVAPVSSHSIPIGAIMVPRMAPAMVVTQSGLVPKFFSTASDQQSLGKSLFHLANGHVEARHTGLPLVTHAVPQTVVSSTLTPQLNNLKISKGTPQPFQKPVYAEKRDQSAQTHDSHGLPATASLAQSSELTDSGTETGDSLRVNDEDTSQSSEEINLDGAVEAGGLGKKFDRLEVAGWTGSNFKEELGLDLLSDAAIIHSERESGVDEENPVVEIYPRSSPLGGGGDFMIIFDKNLPCDVTSAIAWFGNHNLVTLRKLNEFNMAGRIPAAHAPGLVEVTVRTLTRRLLGETTFTYVDDVENVLQLLLHDRRLQARYFFLLAEELGKSTTETGSDRSASSDNLARQKHVLLRLLRRKTKGSEDCLETERLENLGGTVEERGYESDDEASSSSEEEFISYACNFDDNYKNLSDNAIIAVVKKTIETDNRDLCEGLDGTRKLCASQLMGAPRYRNVNREPVLPKHKSEEYTSHVRDETDVEQLVEKIKFIRWLKTEVVAVKDSVEEISSNLQESEPAISPLNSDSLSALPRRYQTETPDFVSQGREDAERLKNQHNPEVVHGQLNSSDSNENSLSDKSRRANCVKRRNQVNDTPAEDL